MMNLEKLIKTKMKDRDVIIGYNRVMRTVKTKKPKLIIYANNFPEEKIKILKHNARIAKIEVEEYPKDSVDLGLVCGKPFTVGTLAIK